MLKSLIIAALTIVSTIASAAQVATYKISNIELTYSTETQKVYASGTLINGQVTFNSITKVIVNGIDGGVKLAVDDNIIKVIYANNTNQRIGFVSEGQVVLEVPYTALQVSERYDAVEKSFGLIDVDYITLDIKL